MNWTLAIGGVVIVALLVMFEEHEKTARVASAAQASADASVYAVENQGNEITNVPPGGVSYQNAPQTQLPLTPLQIADGESYNAQGELQAPVQ